MSESTHPSKTGGIIIGVITLLLLVGFVIYLAITYHQKTGLFRNYEPNLSAGLVQAQPNSLYVPMTPKTKAKRDALVNAALKKLQTRRSLTAPTPGPST